MGEEDCVLFVWKLGLPRSDDRGQTGGLPRSESYFDIDFGAAVQYLGLGFKLLWIKPWDGVLGVLHA